MSVRDKMRYSGLKGRNLASVIDVTATGLVNDTFDEAVICVVMPNATQNVDITLPYKFEITEITAIKDASAGGAGDQVIVQNITTAISNVISLNIAAKTIARVTTIDLAQTVIPAGTNLRVAMTKVTSCGGRLLIYGIRR